MKKVNRKKLRRTDPLIRTPDLGAHFEALRPLTEELCQRFADLPDDDARAAYILTIETVANALRDTLAGQIPGAKKAVITGRIATVEDDSTRHPSEPFTL